MEGNRGLRETTTQLPGEVPRPLERDTHGRHALLHHPVRRIHGGPRRLQHTQALDHRKHTLAARRGLWQGLQPEKGEELHRELQHRQENHPRAFEERWHRLR